MAAKINADAFSNAFNSGDPKQVARLYTEDAQAFPPGRQMVEGRKAIEQMWESVQQDFSDVRLEQHEVIETGDGNYACESGTWTSRHQNRTVEGKYLTVWKKEGSTWKVHRDMWNRDD